jgi:glutaredoxin 3
MVMKDTKSNKEIALGRSDKRLVPAKTLQPIVMYTTRFCPYCVSARGLLESKGWNYQDIPVDTDQGLRSEIMRKSGQQTVPQIWIGDQHVGGCDELFRLEADNQLETMVTGEIQ